MNDVALRQQARRAYEVGRLLRAARHAVFVIPLILLSRFGCGSPATTALFGGGLVALVVVLSWRGGEWGRALGPGLTGGIVPFAIPIVTELTGNGCSDGSCWPLEVASLAGGLWAGAVVGLNVARRPHPWRKSLGGALAVAWVTGSLGCLALGSLALAGMGLAMLVAAAPLAVLRRGLQ